MVQQLPLLPASLNTVGLSTAPAACPTLDKVEHLRSLAEGWPASKPPLAWLPNRWRDEVTGSHR
jgi:hypothetical protein